ncbi:MAG: FUN14 domain-containing protein [Phycisphaerae bacterium]|nr:FUN14 domain-containing protein [Phycisphaerae bacterium]
MADAAMPKRASLLTSRALWVGLLITALGAAMWVYSATTRPATASAVVQPPASGVSGASSLAPGFAPGTSGGGGGLSAAPMESGKRLIDESAPATFRFGFSFLAGFGIAYAFKKFVRAVFIVAALGAAGFLAAKYFGLLSLDWSVAQAQMEEGVELARSHADRIKGFLTGYLPSGAAAVVGMFMGVRRG